MLYLYTLICIFKKKRFQIVFMKRGVPYEKGGFQYYLKQHETNGMENNRTPSPLLHVIYPKNENE